MKKSKKPVSKVKVKMLIPFRDRGLDPRRLANLEVVMAWWWAYDLVPAIVTDGLNGDDQFNRHKAYNLGVDQYPEADVYVFTEADMLLPIKQIGEAIQMAYDQPGLVVPFTQYRYLTEATTTSVREAFADEDTEDLAKAIERGFPFDLEPESTMDNGRSIGAVNVVSRETLELTGGFTEATSGNWYDDRIIEEGWQAITRHRTRHVDGPAVHLYHLPGWTGDHLTEADKRATRNNRDLLVNMRADIRMGNLHKVRDLMGVRA